MPWVASEVADSRKVESRKSVCERWGSERGLSLETPWGWGGLEGTGRHRRPALGASLHQEKIQWGCLESCSVEGPWWYLGKAHQRAKSFPQPVSSSFPPLLSTPREEHPEYCPTVSSNDRNGHPLCPALCLASYPSILVLLSGATELASFSFHWKLHLSYFLSKLKISVFKSSFGTNEWFWVSHCLSHPPWSPFILHF